MDEEATQKRRQEGFISTPSAVHPTAELWLFTKLLWWPEVDRDIERVIKHCATCQANADNPRVSKMCLIVINTFSKWPEHGVLQSTSAGITVERLRTVFANKGISEILISDNSPQFVAGVCNNFVSWCQCFLISVILSLVAFCVIVSMIFA